MPNLTDLIEAHLKQLLREAGAGTVEVRRAELADRFSCVPSQINYVLETRFTLQRGYLVESRRGGGGYIRIVRVEVEGGREGLLEWLEREVGDRVSARGAAALLDRMVEAGWVEPVRAALARAVMRRETGRWPAGVRDQMRAAVLRGILPFLLQQG